MAQGDRGIRLRFIFAKAPFRAPLFDQVKPSIETHLPSNIEKKGRCRRDWLRTVTILFKYPHPLFLDRTRKAVGIAYTKPGGSIAEEQEFMLGEA
jgi:hypothetical protein